MPLFVSLLFLGSLQSAAATQSVTPPPVALSARSDVFADTDLHVVYKLPEPMRGDAETAASTSQTLLKAAGKTKIGKPCVSLPFVGVADQDFRIVYVFRRSGGCPDFTDVTKPGQTAVASFSGSLGGLGDALVGEPIPYTLGGHDAAVVRGRALSKKLGGVVYGAMACVSFVKDMLCWEFLAGSREVLNAMAQTPVTLEGKFSPIIPEASMTATSLPNQVFRNESKHFEVSFPGDMVRTDEQTQTAMKEAQAKAEIGLKEKAACISAPMSASENTPSGAVTFVVLQASSGCGGSKLTSADLGEFAVGVVKGISKTMRNQFAPALQYKVAGYDAVVLRGSLFSANGRENSIAVACIALDGDIDCFEVVAPSQQRVSELLNSSLKFDDKPPTPIVVAQSEK